MLPSGTNCATSATPMSAHPRLPRCPRQFPADFLVLGVWHDDCHHGNRMAHKRSSLKSSFVVTLSALGAAGASIVACGGKTTDGVAEPDLSSPSSGAPGPDNPGAYNPPPPPCPANEPTVGETCTPRSSCAYPDTCKSRPDPKDSHRSYLCITGVWKRSQVSYVAECPVVRPTTGESCASCADAYPGSCSYPNRPESGCPPVLVHCDVMSGTWQAPPSSCNPPPPDAGDGG